MGKPVLWMFSLGFLGLIGSLNLAQDPQKAPERPKGGAGVEYPFVPGRFLTADDYGHVEAALGCVDLKPADLSFEKKVALNQRFILPVCAAALDNPLGVPKLAEDAASDFNWGTHVAARAQRAASILERDVKRFDKEELRKDSAGWVLWSETNDKLWEFVRKWRNERPKDQGMKEDAEWKRLSEECDKAWADTVKDSLAMLFGGESKVVQAVDNKNMYWDNKGVDQDFAIQLYTSVMAISSDMADPKGIDVALLAALLPSHLAEDELRVPGAKAGPVEGDPFEPANKAFRTGSLVAAARLNTVMEAMAAQWQRCQIPGAAKDFAGVPSTVQGVTGDVLAIVQGPLGKFVIGGMGDNTYAGDDFIAILDLGGNDTYKGRVACGNGLSGHAPLGFVLDLSGDDRYEGEDFTQGFGFLGVGILWDLGAGRDFYRSRFCSQACGLCGYGELFDDGGDDVYITDSCSQGAACFGYGHLIDKAGNDTYKGCRFVQAYANCMGLGVLSDGAGNDLYYAGGKYLHVPLHNDHYQSLSQGFAFGNRNDGNPAMGTGGGVALLLDQGNGNDVYQADIYGQGVSYWLALGMLVDEGGNDTHTIFQYGLGGGIHLSTGILVNVSGNDSYTNGWGVGTGGAHDYAVGWLIDGGGNDFYQGNGQGQALNFSFACLLDKGGDDSHCSNMDGNIGAGANNDVSLMLDLDGSDFYGVEGAKNGRFIRRGNHGLLYDCPSGGWFKGIDMSTLPTKQDPAPKKVKVQHILISYDGCGVKLKNAQGRSEQEAQVLAAQVLKLARTQGADWAKLQTLHNEDSGDAGSNDHATYECEASTAFIPEFKDMALTLGVGQIGISKKGKYGWHIIKRVE